MVVNRGNAPLREAYVYVKDLISWPSTQTATLTLETPEPSSPSSSCQAVIDKDNIGLKIGNQVVIYKKPTSGWMNMRENIRARMTNGADWAPKLNIDINGNYFAACGNQYDHWSSPDGHIYFYEIVPVLCDDPETLTGFQIAYGQSIANSKGLLTVGGTPSSIELGGRANFRGTSITVKDGFHAKFGSTVRITATTCESF